MGDTASSAAVSAETSLIDRKKTQSVYISITKTVSAYIYYIYSTRYLNVLYIDERATDVYCVISTVGSFIFHLHVCYSVVSFFL